MIFSPSFSFPYTLPLSFLLNSEYIENPSEEQFSFRLLLPDEMNCDVHEMLALNNGSRHGDNPKTF